MIGERAYENALKRRDQLQEELACKQREFDEVQGFLALCERFAGMATAAVEVRGLLANQEMPASRLPSRRKLTTVSGMDLLPYIRAAILEIGKPLKRGPIVRALEERGIRVGGEEPARNIGTIMWRAKTERGEFESFDKLGYWPVDAPYPPMGYEPPPDNDDDTDDESAPRPQEQGPPSERSDLWEQAASGA